MAHFDYFVIGGGSGGVRSARIAAQHGVKVGLAEKSHLGGTCVNVGCVPKKLFSYAANYGQHLEDMKGFGWENVQASFNWQKLVERKNSEIERLNNIYQSLLANAGVELFRGCATFIDNNTLEINDETITADKILIAVGGKPKAPHFPGAEYAVVSDDLFYLDNFPKRVVIQGGGYIAVEFAHIFHGLGAKVTLLYYKDLWMSSFDKEVSLFLKEEYTKQGIDLQFNTNIEYVTNDGASYQVHTTNEELIECDLVVSAIGRQPETKALNLQNTDVITLPNGQIKITSDWQSSVSNIYAVGDVSNSWNLTPYAIAEGHMLADNLFGTEQTKVTNLNLVPTAIFSKPEIGTIGLSEEQAKEEKYNYQVYRSTFRPLIHTLSENEEKTFLKLIVDLDQSEKIIGCHIVGLDAAEMLQGIAIAINMGATKKDFDNTIGIHPTSAEEIVTLK